jgi:hypothetical protein
MPVAVVLIQMLPETAVPRHHQVPTTVFPNQPDSNPTVLLWLVSFCLRTSCHISHFDIDALFSSSSWQISWRCPSWERSFVVLLLVVCSFTAVCWIVAVLGLVLAPVIAPRQRPTWRCLLPPTTSILLVLAATTGFKNRSRWSVLCLSGLFSFLCLLAPVLSFSARLPHSY